MSFDMIKINPALVDKYTVEQIMRCNEETAEYGLYLTADQATQLVNTRTYALKANGRMEFGGGIIDKLILQFATSPYISRENYSEVIHELIEIFYYYKNDLMDAMNDDDLIAYMSDCFNGVCQGSLSLMADRELEKMARNVRFGYKLKYSADEEDCDDEQYDDE